MRYLIWFLLIIVLLTRVIAVRENFQDGDKIRITTKVINEPLKYENSQRISVDGLIIYLPLFPEIHYGDKVIIEGVVSENRLEDPILIDVFETKGLIFQFRKKIISTYRQSLSEPYSSLIAGVTFGSKSNIPQDFWETLKNSGAAHVVVASGMNVTLVAGFLLNLLILVLPRRQAVSVTLIGIWCYSLIADFDALIIRAAIMSSIGFFA